MISEAVAWPSGQRQHFRWRKFGCRFKSRCDDFQVFFLSFLYPLAFLLFILTADPVTFARFSRKRISSNVIKQLVSASAVHMSRY